VRAAKLVATLFRRCRLENPSLAPRAAGRDVAIDLLKILGICGVLLMHGAGMLAFGGRKPDLLEARYMLLYLSFANYCIPVFLMCSGAMLLSGGRDQAPLTFYRKRLPRLLVPLIFWSAIYFMYTEQAWLSLDNLPLFLNRLLAGKVLGLLWYLYMLLGIYLSAPFLQMVLRQAERSHLWVFVVICLVPASLQTQLENVLVVNWGLQFSIFTTYLGFFVLGHLLHTAGPSPRGLRPAMVVVWAILAVVGYEAQLWVQTKSSVILYNFLDYRSINVALGAIAFFLVWRGLDIPLSASGKRVLAFLANATYGIYLVHFLTYLLLTHGLFGISLPPGRFHPALGIPLTAACMLALSLIVVGLLSQIPVLRELVGFSGRKRPARPRTA
jgi:surface polysaccharide O-acyltransferase-like enzyme